MKQPVLIQSARHCGNRATTIKKPHALSSELSGKLQVRHSARKREGANGPRAGGWCGGESEGCMLTWIGSRGAEARHLLSGLGRLAAAGTSCAFAVGTLALGCRRSLGQGRRMRGFQSWGAGLGQHAWGQPAPPGRVSGFPRSTRAPCGPWPPAHNSGSTEDLIPGQAPLVSRLSLPACPPPRGPSWTCYSGRGTRSRLLAPA